MVKEPWQGSKKVQPDHLGQVDFSVGQILFCPSNMTNVQRPWGSGGCSHIYGLYRYYFAAQHGMLFPSLTLEQGIQNHSLSLEEGYILLHFESGTG